MVWGGEVFVWGESPLQFGGGGATKGQRKKSGRGGGGGGGGLVSWGKNVGGRPRRGGRPRGNSSKWIISTARGLGSWLGALDASPVGRPIKVANLSNKSEARAHEEQDARRDCDGLRFLSRISARHHRSINSVRRRILHRYDAVPVDHPVIPHHVSAIAPCQAESYHVSRKCNFSRCPMFPSVSRVSPSLSFNRPPGRISKLDSRPPSRNRCRHAVPGFCSIVGRHQLALIRHHESRVLVVEANAVIEARGLRNE